MAWTRQMVIARGTASVVAGTGVLLWFFLVNPPVDLHDNVYESAPVPEQLRGVLRFEEVATSLGLHYEHDTPVKGMDSERTDVENKYNSLGVVTPSVAVADVNRDGFPDIFIPNTDFNGKNLLYLNEGGMKFREAAEEFGVARTSDSTTVSSMAAFADFNGDGHEDLFVSRYGTHKLFLREKGRGFTERSELLQGYASKPEAVNVLDFNRDGRPDLVFGNYLPAPGQGTYFERWGSNNLLDNFSGGKNVLLLQQPDRSFAIAQDVDFKTRSWTHAAGVSDVNHDGYPDIFFANDYGYDQFFRNEGGKAVHEITQEVAPQEFSGLSGMNADFGDLHHTGHLNLYVTNIHKPPFKRTFNLSWNLNPKGREKMESLEMGTSKCGFAWGAKYADFDNDSELDLVVGNGRSQDIDVRTIGDGKSLWFKRAEMARMPSALRQLSFRKEEDLSGTFISAFERPCLFLNRGRQFHDVASFAGLNDLQNERGVAVLDYDNDGRIDIITVSFFGKLRLYRNVSPNPGGWIGFELRDRSGSVIPHGAWLRLRIGDTWRYKELYPLNGYRAQSDWRAHFGLGNGRASVLEVLWPDGNREAFRDLKPGQYQRIEAGRGEPLP